MKTNPFCKIHPGLLIAAALLCSGCLANDVSGLTAIEPEQEEEIIEEPTFQELVYDELQAVQCPEEIEEEFFEELKTRALAAKSEEDANYQIFTNIDAYDNDILEFYLKEEGREAFVLEYPNRDQYETPANLLEEDLSEVPLLLQWDLRWGYCAYGDSTIQHAGCGPTSLAMVLSYLLQDPTMTPAVMAQYSVERGFYVSGSGTSHTLMSDVGYSYPVTALQISVDAETIASMLSEGYILILNVGPGDFTAHGHFIVADGIEDNLIQIKDPNSAIKSKGWDLDQVVNQTKAAFAYKSQE